MKIHCLGWYDHCNVGDEAYKIAFPKIFPQHSFTFSEDAAINDIDLTILGGGDVVNSYFTSKINYKVPTIAASVTLTPASDFNAKLNKVIVRDIKSYEVGTDKFKVEYIPDFTFILEGNRNNGRNIIENLYKQEKHKLKDKIVIVCVSNYVMFPNPRSPSKDFTAFLKLSQDLGEIMDNTDASFIFLPFCSQSPYDDRASNAFVESRSTVCRRKNLVVYDRFSVQDTLDIIAASDAVISTRLHLTIFSTLCGIPFLDITHHDKNLGFIKTLGKMDWSFPFWQFNGLAFQELLNKHLSGGKDVVLQNFTLSAKDQILKCQNILN